MLFVVPPRSQQITSHKPIVTNDVLILTNLNWKGRSQKKENHDAELFLELIRTIYFRYRLP
jgi:hypothetical protein